MFLKRVFNFIPKNEFSHALDSFNRGDYPKALRKFEALLADETARDNLDVQTIELYTCEAHVGMSKHHSENGRIRLGVEDDGVGIPEARLATLLESGVGVSNVNERLKVLFGNDYRMYVDSRPDGGTRIEIEIPELQASLPAVS